jgi:hypothetical protein
MAVNVISNRGSYDRSGSLGIGGRIQPVLVNWVGVTADAEGGVITLSAGDVTAHKDAVYQGYFFQALGSAVKVEYTLVNPGVACDPRNIGVTAYWNNAQTVPGTGVITPAMLAADTPNPIGFAALRLTFTAACEFYIVAR